MACFENVECWFFRCFRRFDFFEFLSKFLWFSMICCQVHWLITNYIPNQNSATWYIQIRECVSSWHMSTNEPFLSNECTSLVRFGFLMFRVYCVVSIICWGHSCVSYLLIVNVCICMLLSAWNYKECGQSVCVMFTCCFVCNMLSCSVCFGFRWKLINAHVDFVQLNVERRTVQT